MGIVNITSWTSLRNKLQDYYGENSIPVYTLTTDIDLNDEFPSGVTTTNIIGFSTYSSVAHTIIIDGKDPNTGVIHKIKNLRTNISSPQPIFKWNNGSSYTDATIIFRNIDFINLILAGSHFYDSNSYTRILNFNNCRFVGCRTGNAFIVNDKRKITFTSCYVDMPWYAANQALGTLNCTSCIAALTDSEIGNDGSNLPQAYYCWFHETYGGWAVGEGSQSGARVMTQCGPFCLHGCYIDGNMKAEYSLNYSSGRFVTLYCYVYTKALRNAYTASTPNVIDMHWFTDQEHTCTDPSFHSSARFERMNAVVKKDVTIPGADTLNYTVTDFSGDPQPVPILATAAQMKDVTWLRNQGFPIIDPTT